MENLVFTQLSVPEIRNLFRQELETFFITRQDFASGKVDFDQLLTIKQASELIDLTVPTIYGYVQKGIIPCSKKGKRLYFSKLKLIEWVKEGNRKTSEEVASEALAEVTKKAF